MEIKKVTGDLYYTNKIISHNRLVSSNSSDETNYHGFVSGLIPGASECHVICMAVM